jgi:hypothetical protein
MTELRDLVRFAAVDGYVTNNIGRGENRAVLAENLDRVKIFRSLDSTFAFDESSEMPALVPQKPCFALNTGSYPASVVRPHQT